MKSAGSYLEQVVLGNERGLLSYIIRLCLLPFMLIYISGLAIYLFIYKLGIRKRIKLSTPVISVGNITFGGTGKTPAVQTISDMLKAKGLRVVVLSRGHGGSAKGVVVVSDEHSILTDSATSGDEPMLLAQSLKGIPVVVGKDRRQSGKVAIERFNPDVIILDDGFQYWQLERDIDIVLLDAAKPFGSKFVLPAGDLRVPVSHIKKASVIFITNTNAVDEKIISKTVKAVSSISPQAKIYKCRHEPKNIINAQTNQLYPLEWLKERKAIAFCGIGKPISFIDMLESLKTDLRGTIVFRDHHRYTNEDIKSIINEQDNSDSQVIITTQKDIARLESDTNLKDLYALTIRLEIEGNTEFAEYITNRINKQN